MSEEEDATNESSSTDAKLKEQAHIVEFLTRNKNVLKVISNMLDLIIFILIH